MGVGRSGGSSDGKVQFGPVQAAFCLNSELDLAFSSDNSLNLEPDHRFTFI